MVLYVALVPLRCWQAKLGFVLDGKNLSTSTKIGCTEIFCLFAFPALPALQPCSTLILSFILLYQSYGASAAYSLLFILEALGNIWWASCVYLPLYSTTITKTSKILMRNSACRYHRPHCCCYRRCAAGGVSAANNVWCHASMSLKMQRLMFTSQMILIIWCPTTLKFVNVSDF